jgi:hypothetical protein
VVAQQGVQGNRAVVAAMLILAGLASCAPPACPLPTQSRATMVTLFFGRDIPGGGQVSDTDWAAFAAATLTDQFPDGLTISDGGGQWRDPETRRVSWERTKIVLIAVPEPASGLAARISRVTRLYRAQFHQEAVGVVSVEVCAAF